MTDAHGFPRYWATVWDVLHGPAMKPSTAGTKLGVIDRFYHHVADACGDDRLDALLSAADLDQLEPLMESFFVKLRTASMRTKTDRTRDWVSVFSFVKDVVERQGRIRDVDDLAIFDGPHQPAQQAIRHPRPDPGRQEKGGASSSGVGGG